MTWPIPTPLPTNWVNGTSQYDNHPQAHNALADAINELVAHITLAAWATYVPTLTQGAAVAKTVTSATYMRIGRLIVAQVNLAITGAGTGGQSFRIGLPVAARAANAVNGFGALYDLSAGFRYVCSIEGATVNDVGLASDGTSSDFLGASPNVALASGDSIKVAVIYEAVN